MCSGFSSSGTLGLFDFPVMKPSIRIRLLQPLFFLWNSLEAASFPRSVCVHGEGKSTNYANHFLMSFVPSDAIKKPPMSSVSIVKSHRRLRPRASNSVIPSFLRPSTRAESSLPQRRAWNIANVMSRAPITMSVKAKAVSKCVLSILFISA